MYSTRDVQGRDCREYFPLLLPSSQLYSCSFGSRHVHGLEFSLHSGRLLDVKAKCVYHLSTQNCSFRKL